MARRKKEPLPGPLSAKDLSEQKVLDKINQEYTTGLRNNEMDDAEFEAILDLLECKRNERDYEWMSDVFIPEYPSIHLTEASQWANQYFQSRDFVEVYLSGETPEDKVRAAMVKKFINTSLNQKEVYHFIKYMQIRGINSTRGASYALCRWERQEKKPVAPAVQPEPSMDMLQLELEPEAPPKEPQVEIIVDRFNYDPIDPRNVIVDNKYAYSLQQKEYVIIRDEVTYEQLRDEAVRKGYFNLDKLRNLGEDEGQTETAKGSYNKVDGKETPTTGINPLYDRLLRFGKMWSVVTESGVDGYPVKSKPGYDEKGQILDSAELVESIIEVILCHGKQILIRFQPTPYRTSKGIPYKPIIRGLCYIHPTKDIGMSSGKYSRELQVALNDTVNISNDRVKLATLPTFKGQQNAVTNNDQIYFEPEHIIPLPNTADLEEIDIKSDIRGAMMQADLFIKKMQQVNSVYPTTMGDLPVASSTTATAVAGSEAKSNLRANYAALTFEYTFFAEFYWMMLQMAYQFMHPETAIKLWGQFAMLYDPDADYSYTPVSSNIEQEYHKDRKVTRYDQIMGRIAQIPNPAIIPIVAEIIGRQLVLLGAEYQDIKQMIDTLKQTPNTPEQGAAPGETPPNAEEMPASNQAGVPMGLMEQGMRGVEGG